MPIKIKSLLHCMDVSVVHISDWIMERQLDQTAANMLRKSLEAKGMKILTWVWQAGGIASRITSLSPSSVTSIAGTMPAYIRPGMPTVSSSAARQPAGG